MATASRLEGSGAPGRSVPSARRHAPRPARSDRELLATGLRALAGATALSIIMLGAILTSHLEHGFFMNWFGQQAGEGFEYHLLALALSVPLTAWGGGRYSLDRLLLRALTRRAELR